MLPRISTRLLSRLGMLALVASSAAATFAPTTAHAGGPRRLTAALEALRNAQKQLEEAKEPPAALHEKSLAVVRKAVEAVEKEIKAYNDQEAAAKAKATEPAKVDPKADPKAVDPKTGKPKAAPAAKETTEKKPAPKPAAPKPAEDPAD